MAKLTPSAALSVINTHGGGMNDATLERALAVAYAESSLDKDVVNSIGATGLFQILVPVHIRAHPDWTYEAMKDPAKNVVAAKTLSNNWRNWTPWTAFNTGAYLLYIPQAKKDVAAWHKGLPASGSAVLNAAVGGSETVVDTAVSGAQAAASAYETVTNPHNWLRVAYGVMGIGLIWFSIAGIVSGNKVVSAVTKIATKGVVS